ncbi:MAG: hypothetical protein WC803_06045 [Sphingomonas sp.]|jgi:hypothetical protein
MIKRECRTKTFLTARMRHGAQWLDVAIHNVSLHGMLVWAGKPPDPGSYIEIRKSTLVIVARTIWAKGNFFGVRTQDGVNIPALLGTKSPAVKNGFERRAAPRHKPGIAAQHDQNRQLAAKIEFLLLIAGIVAIGLIAASQVYTIMAQPLQTIATALESAN